jgi:hypothetical protein
MYQIDGFEEFRGDCMLQQLFLTAKTLSELLRTSSGRSYYKPRNSQGEGVRRPFLGNIVLRNRAHTGSTSIHYRCHFISTEIEAMHHKYT